MKIIVSIITISQWLNDVEFDIMEYQQMLGFLVHFLGFFFFFLNEKSLKWQMNHK